MKWVKGVILTEKNCKFDLEKTAIKLYKNCFQINKTDFSSYKDLLLNYTFIEISWHHLNMKLVYNTVFIVKLSKTKFLQSLYSNQSISKLHPNTILPFWCIVYLQFYN